jgi:[acyl-carrier-protein] S-malonyltransferase
VYEAGEKLKQVGARFTPTSGSVPFHSVLMIPAALQWKEHLKGYKFNEPRWLVISNATVAPYESADQIAHHLTTQMANPVLWKFIMEYIQKCGITIALEIGPQSVLKKLSRINTPEIQAFSFDSEEDNYFLRSEFFGGGPE